MVHFSFEFNFIQIFLIELRLNWIEILDSISSVIAIHIIIHLNSNCYFIWFWFYRILISMKFWFWFWFELNDWRSKYFRGRRILGDWDVRVEQAEFSELTVVASSEHGVNVSMTVFRNATKVVRSLSSIAFELFFNLFNSFVVFFFQIFIIFYHTFFCLI